MIKNFSKVIPVFVFLLISNITLAQFKTFNFDSITFYQYHNPSYGRYGNSGPGLGLLGPTGDYIPVKIRGENLVDLDTIYTNSLVFKKNASNRYDDCYAKISPAWTGKKIIIKDQRDIFINADNDSIIFRKDASLNDSWTFYSTEDNHFIATVTQKTIENFNIYGSTLTDSIMTITINLKKNLDDSPVQHIFNGREWKISKKYGLVKTYDLLNFPKDTTTLTLAGINGKGIKNLTFRDIYNFEIGDIFHTVDSSERSYKVGTNTISRVVDKKTTDTEIIYKIENWFKKVRYDPLFPGLQKSEGKDTTEIKVNLTQSSPDGLDNLPTLIYPGFYSFHIYQFINKETSLLSKGSIFLNLKQSEVSPDSCYNQSGSEAGIAYEYIEGLGGPYYSGVHFGDMPVWVKKKLVYYKKGTKEWGTPLSMMTGIDRSKINSNVNLFPNPSNDKIKITSDGIQNSFYKIYNYEGREILSGYFTSNEEVISVKELTSGIYSVVILNENGAIYSSKFVKN